MTVPLSATFLDSRPALLIASFLGGSALFAIGIVESSLWATVTIAVLLATIGTILVGVEDDTPVCLVRVFLVIFGFRLCVLAALHFMLVHGYGEPYWDFGADGGDERWFYERAERFSIAWQQGAIVEMVPQWQEMTTFGWLFIVGVIRGIASALGGDTVFNAKLVSCVATAIMVAYTYKITLRVADAATAQRSLFVGFILPDYWFYGSTLMRDAFISLLLALTFCQFVEIAKVRFRWWRLLLALAVNFGVLGFLRLELPVVVAGVAGMCMLVSGTHGRPRETTGTRVVGTILMLVFAASAGALLWRLGWGYVEYRIGVSATVGIEQASAGSVGAKILGMPIYMRVPLSFAHLLLTPLPPWGDLQSLGVTPNGLLGTISGIVWWMLLPFLLIGFVTCLRGNLKKYMWIWATSMGIGMLLAVSSSIMPRWRLMIMPFLVVILAVGCRQWRHLTALPFLSVSVIPALLGLYWALKYIAPEFGMRGTYMIASVVLGAGTGVAWLSSRRGRVQPS